MKISVLIPVYNEKKTILDVINLVIGVNFDKEIILVDDFSTDGTRELLKKRFGSGEGSLKVFYHNENKGKGSAIRTAIENASGEYIVVQDGDLEYSPDEMLKMLELIRKEKAIAVYGSRFLETWKTTSLSHFAINKFLTILTNILFGSSLTDMETCYKMIRLDVIKGLALKAKRFEFEPEVTVKLIRKGVKIEEVPISYRGRWYDEGKKITWRDGIEAVMTLLKLRFSDL